MTNYRLSQKLKLIGKVVKQIKITKKEKLSWGKIIERQLN
jgi:hypothetical protein